MKTKINVKDIDVSVINIDSQKFICLTDIAKKKNSDHPRFVVINWLRNRNTVEFLGIWEHIYNDKFNRVGFDTVRKEAGLNSFTISPTQWIKKTNAKGIITKSGRYNSGTCAHKDIALEFASWISPEFKLYLIKEFRRLKQKESNYYNLDWNLKRRLAKINYKIHTDAIERYLIPENISSDDKRIIYADEADVLNLALFGKTSKEWKDKNPNLEENIRDYVSILVENSKGLNSLEVRE